VLSAKGGIVRKTVVVTLVALAMLLGVTSATADAKVVSDPGISMVIEDGGGGGWTGPIGGCVWMWSHPYYGWYGWYYHPTYGHAVLPC
jgi:hypothetical protein